MTDQRLIELYTARSEEAIAETERIYGAYCRTIAGRILGNEEDAEECLSDVWLRVWNAIPPQQPTNFKGWIGAITRNAAISLCRRKDREPQRVGDAALELALDLTEGPEREVEAKVLGEAISAFLQAQPAQSRIAFLRRYWYGDTVEETAKYMGWGVGKTKTNLFRTRQKLKDYLKKEDLYHG